MTTLLTLLGSLLPTSDTTKQPPTISKLSDLFLVLGMNDLMYPDLEGYDIDLPLDRLHGVLESQRILRIDRRLPTEHTEGGTFLGAQYEHHWKIHHRPVQVAGVDGQLYFIQILRYAPTPMNEQVSGRIGDEKIGREFHFTLRELCECLGFQFAEI